MNLAGGGHSTGRGRGRGGKRGRRGAASAAQATSRGHGSAPSGPSPRDVDHATDASAANAATDAGKPAPPPTCASDAPPPAADDGDDEGMVWDSQLEAACRDAELRHDSGSATQPAAEAPPSPAAARASDAGDVLSSSSATQPSAGAVAAADASGGDGAAYGERPQQRAAAASAASAIAASGARGASGASGVPTAVPRHAGPRRGAAASSITKEQAAATQKWLAEVWDEWGGRWPPCGTEHATHGASIKRQLAQIGISAKQAQRQLGAYRLSRSSGDEAAGVDSARDMYYAMLAGALDESDIITSAFERSKSDQAFVARAGLDHVLKRMAQWPAVRKAATGLLHDWCSLSADAWSAGGTGAPMAFISARFQLAMPRWQRALLAATMHNGALVDDLRLVGCVLEQELYDGYCAATAVGARPTIAEPLGPEMPTLNGNDRATVYDIAGYLLKSIKQRLAYDDTSDRAIWCRALVERCSIPLSEARKKKLPFEKILARTRGGLISCTMRSSSTCWRSSASTSPT